MTPQNPAYQNIFKTHCPYGHPYTPDNTLSKQHNGRIHRDCRECNKQRVKKGYLRRHPNAFALLSAANTSGFLGARWHKVTSKWSAVVNNFHFGLYDDIEEAAYIYDQVALQLHGDKAKINILTGPSIPWPSQIIDAA